LATEEEAEVTTSSQINRAIRRQLISTPSVTIDGLKGQDYIAPGFPADSFININGAAGDYLGAFTRGSVVTLNGACGRFAGDTMVSGGLVVNGDCGFGAGVSMLGGILVVRGSAADNLGMWMRGGTVLVAGDAGAGAGTDMSGGELIVTGSVGPGAGAGMQAGRMFVGADVEGQSGDVREETPTRSELERISVYFDHYGVEADAGSMRKFVPAGPGRRSASTPWGRDSGSLDTPRPVRANDTTSHVGLDSFTIRPTQLSRPQAGDLHRVPPALASSVTGGTGGRELEFPLPLFFTMPRPDLGGPGLRLAMLKAAGELGVPLFEGDATSLPAEKGIRERFGTQLAAGFTPARLGLDPDPISGARAVEVSLSFGGQGGLNIPAGAVGEEAAVIWGLTPERDFMPPLTHPDAETLSDVGRIVELIRELTGGRSPVLMGLWAGDIAQDVRAALKLGADAVVLKCPGTWTGPGGDTGSMCDQGMPTPAAIASARRALDEEAGMKGKVPLLVRGRFLCAGDVFKALALGANAVSAEWAFDPGSYEEAGTPPLSGKAGGAGDESRGAQVGKDDWEAEGSRVVELLRGMDARFRRLMAQTGHRKLTDISMEDLRALSYDASVLTGVKLAGYDDPAPVWMH